MCKKTIGQFAKIFVLFLFWLEMTSLVHAQEDKPVCDEESITTMGMAACEEQDYQKADAQLNATYKKIMALAKQQDDEAPDPTGWSGIALSIKESQKAWVVFRDNECLLRTVGEVGGSVRQITYPACQKVMTQERTKELEKFLACLKKYNCE